MAKLKALWDQVADSLWFVPAVLTALCAALAIGLIALSDNALEDVDPSTAWWLFGGSAEGAQGVLTAIASSIITVTGVVFSVTIVALQLASSQFTPRVLRQFTADRANQVVLGVFIGTFTYTLLVQRTIRSADGQEAFVPHLAVTGAVVLALLSIAFLIFFVNHAARTIQASVIIDSVAGDTLRVLERVFPEKLDDGAALPSAGVGDYSAGRPDEPHAVVAGEAGYVQAVDLAALMEIARFRQVLVRIEIEIGSYVLPGQVIAHLWPGDSVAGDVAGRVRSSLVLGLERTHHQDVKFGVIELMDIAVKAMSPSVNDPTTAMNALDRIGEILLALAWRKRGDRIELHRDGRPLLLMPRPRLDDTVALAYDQIRHYAAGNPAVASEMIRQAAELVALAPDEAKPVFREHLSVTRAAALRRIDDPHDRERVEAAAAAALVRAAEPDTSAQS
jgi:uncharacterized membrane protein